MLEVMVKNELKKEFNEEFANNQINSLVSSVYASQGNLQVKNNSLSEIYDAGYNTEETIQKIENLIIQ